MQFSIDRFENDKAVLIDEYGDTVVVDREVLPEMSKEGDILDFSDGVYTFLSEKTNAKRIENASRIKGLFKK